MWRAASSLSSASLSSSLSLLSSSSSSLLLLLLLLLVLLLVLVLVLESCCRRCRHCRRCRCCRRLRRSRRRRRRRCIAVAAWSCCRCRCYLCSWYFLQTLQNRQTDGFCKPPKSVKWWCFRDFSHSRNKKRRKYRCFWLRAYARYLRGFEPLSLC